MAYLITSMRNNVERFLDKEQRVQVHEVVETTYVPDPLEWASYIEMYNLMARTQLERDVINFRLEGMTLQEIGDLTNRTRQNISQILQKVVKRWIDHYEH